MTHKGYKYSDMDGFLNPHPGTKDITIKRDMEAIKTSVKNLLLMSPMDKPFHPEINVGLHRYLFENVDPLVILNIRRTIEEVLTVFEPRIEILDLQVIDQTERNGILINLIVQARNIPDPIEIPVFLERIR